MDGDSTTRDCVQYHPTTATPELTSIGAIHLAYRSTANSLPHKLSRASLFDNDILHPDLVGRSILPPILSIINGSRRLDRIRFLCYLHSFFTFSFPEFWAALCLYWATLATLVTYPLTLLSLFLLLYLSLEERLMFSHEYHYWCGKFWVLVGYADTSSRVRRRFQGLVLTGRYHKDFASS
jgi:hypothetical protein